MWKKISSKTILKHPKITIYEDLIEIKSGVTAKYIRYKRRKGAVTLVCTNKDNKFLFVKEYIYPSNRYSIQFPGGSIELKGEDVVAAGKRELQEETGYTADDLKLIGTFIIAKKRSGDMMYVLNGQVLESNVTPVKHDQPDEEIAGIYWFSKDEINKMIATGKIIDANTLACWSVYNACAV